MLQIIQNIKTIRKQKGISQESIAYDLGIDYSTYGKIERGQIALTVDRLEKIGLILKVTIGELYKWHEISTNPSYDTDFQIENSHTKDLRIKLSKCQVELEAAQKEIELLNIQLKDKEKIIALLEHKLTNKAK